MEKQQQNIDLYNLLLQNEENKTKKKYSEEEKKEIYNNIVNRLYKDGVEKYIQKKNKGNNENEIKEQFIINKNFNNNNRNNIKNDLEFEKEPEEEIFNLNYRKIGMNKII